MKKTKIHIGRDTLERARRNDAAARETLYRELGPLVFTLARRMLGSATIAEDVLHETFVEVFTKLKGYRGDGELAVWVRRIAVNKCLMHLRSGWVARRVDLNVTELTPELRDGCLEIEQLALQRALDALPAQARAVVWLHDVVGYTHAEIGSMMGRSPSFSKSQLARAHEKLRGLLDEETEERELEACPSILRHC